MSTCYECGKNECGCIPAEVAALTAERDRLREERDEARADSEYRRGREADLAQEIEDANLERDALTAQLARAETVLQAVAAYVKEHGEFLRMVRRQHSAGRLPKPSRFMLIDAWDAYQATTATTEPKP